MTVPTLRTERLTLRAPQARDARVVTKALNNIDVSRWLTHVPFPYGMTDAEWFINQSAKGRTNAWFIWADKMFVGTIGLQGELGYWIAETAWGQGFATEAGRVVVDHYFATASNDTLRSSHFVENRASLHVLTKLGFLDVGARVHFSKARQADVQGRKMELTRERWQALRDG